MNFLIFYAKDKRRIWRKQRTTARATETLANTNTTHHTHAVVKEAGVRLERTAVRSQQGQNESGGGGGPCLANLQMVNLAVNGLTFSITTYHGEDEREEHQCMRAVCQLEGRAQLHQVAQSLTSSYYELKPRLEKITRDLSLFATYSWSQPKCMHSAINHMKLQ